MDEEIIDRVGAEYLEVGDTVRFDGEDFNVGDLQEIRRIEDNGVEILLFMDDYDEVGIHPDLYVDLYGYAVVEV